MQTESTFLIEPRQRDIGGLAVNRLLPVARRRAVGPFIFFDRMGPVQFAPGSGLDVLPHPHIGLATLTYLFSAKSPIAIALGWNRLSGPATSTG